MKLLAELAPVEGSEPALAERLREVARDLTAHLRLEVASLRRVEGDPFGPRTRWRAALELRGDEADLIGCVSGLAARLGAALDAAASTALVGEEHVLLGAARAPVRYQYVMRRRADFSHEAYLRRYLEGHARFGLRTPGILGYVQVHRAPGLSERAARAAGLGGHAADSVSELQLASLDGFLRAIAGSSIGAEAGADEEQFVDRAHSFDFCSHVRWHERSPA
jgi:hypothetical protein